MLSEQAQRLECTDEERLPSLCFATVCKDASLYKRGEQ